MLSHRFAQSSQKEHSGQPQYFVCVCFVHGRVSNAFDPQRFKLVFNHFVNKFVPTYPELNIVTVEMHTEGVVQGKRHLSTIAEAVEGLCPCYKHLLHTIHSP